MSSVFYDSSLLRQDLSLNLKLFGSSVITGGWTAELVGAGILTPVMLAQQTLFIQ